MITNLKVFPEVEKSMPLFETSIMNSSLYIVGVAAISMNWNDGMTHCTPVYHH